MSEINASKDIIAAWKPDEAAAVLLALSAVDGKDLDYLLTQLDDSGRGIFWKFVVSKLRPVFEATA